MTVRSRLFRPNILMVTIKQRLVSAQVQTFETPFAEGRTVLEASTRELPSPAGSSGRPLTDDAACKDLGALVAGRLQEHSISELWLKLSPLQRLCVKTRHVVSGLRGAGMTVDINCRHRLQ